MYVRFQGTTRPSNFQTYQGRGIKCVDGDIKQVNATLGRSLIEDFPKNFFEATEDDFKNFQANKPKRAKQSVAEDRKETAKLKSGLAKEKAKRKAEDISDITPEGFGVSDEDLEGSPSVSKTDEVEVPDEEDDDDETDDTEDDDDEDV